MNPNLKKISHSIAAILFLSLPFSPIAMSANEVTPDTPTSVPGIITKHSAMIKSRMLAEKEQRIVKEADDVVMETQKALWAVENNDTKKALSLLQDVSGKLDTILKKHPNVALVSADVDTDIIEFEGDAAAVKKAIDEADDLLDDGKLQEARQIIAQLQSEIRMTTTSIPLNSFPKAIKEAEVYLGTGKNNEAASAIYDVLNTLVKTTEITPLPVLYAEILLTEAADIEHKKDLSQEQSRADVLKLADAAKDQLKLAQVLGYGDKNDYKTLYTAIDEMYETIHSEKSAAMWATIKQHLGALKEKLTHLKK
ncbi:MAG: YfdX family protein [Methylococcales bacterium]|nr:YfdX family protein [Methylococcales bacterium]